jgi:hypothetical protein
VIADIRNWIEARLSADRGAVTAGVAAKSV